MFLGVDQEDESRSADAACSSPSIPPFSEFVVVPSKGDAVALHLSTPPFAPTHPKIEDDDEVEKLTEEESPMDSDLPEFTGDEGDDSNFDEAVETNTVEVFEDALESFKTDDDAGEEARPTPATVGSETMDSSHSLFLLAEQITEEHHEDWSPSDFPTRFSEQLAVLILSSRTVTIHINRLTKVLR